MSVRIIGIGDCSGDVSNCCSGIIISGNLASGLTVNQFNFFSGQVINYLNNFYLSSGPGFGYWQTPYPIEFCNMQAWCCTLISGSTSNVSGQLLSGATVFDWNSVTNSTILGFIPQVSGAAQFAVIRNMMSGGVLILRHQSPDALSGYQINLTPEWQPAGQLVLGYRDAAGIWWDKCGEKGWGLLFTTVLAGSITTSGIGQAISGGSSFTLANNQVTLSGTVDISGATATFKTLSGMQLTLPGSGVYRLGANVCGQITPNNPTGGISYILTRLYDSDAGSHISGTIRLVVKGSQANVTYGATAPIDWTYAVTSGITFQLQAAIVFTAPPAGVSILGANGTDATTYMSYFSLGN